MTSFYYFLWDMGSWEWKDIVELDQDKYSSEFWSRNSQKVVTGREWPILHHQLLYISSSWTKCTPMPPGVCTSDVLHSMVALAWTTDAETWTQAEWVPGSHISHNKAEETEAHTDPSCSV